MKRNYVNPLISPDFEDRLDIDGTYLQDCCNIKICSARDINRHGCLLGSAAPRCSYDVGRILRTFKIKKNVEVTDNGKIII